MISKKIVQTYLLGFITPLIIYYLLSNNKEEFILQNESMSVQQLNNPCGYQTNGPRILCLIPTKNISTNKNLKAINETWTKRCDKVMFVIGQDEEVQMNNVKTNF
jgi:hypothetical protein